MKKIITPLLFGSAVLLSLQMMSCTNKTEPKPESAKVNSNSEIESNKKIVLDFYQQMFGDKDLTAVDKYIAPEYIQHNPNVADGSEAFKKAAATDYYRGILAVSDEPLVSSDFIGNSHSGIVDLPLTKVVAGNLVKVMVWYDNEWGYSNRLVELVADVGHYIQQGE